MTFILDQGLKPFATEREWEFMEAWATHGTSRAAADALGASQATIAEARTRLVKRASRRGYNPSADLIHPTAPGMVSRGTSILYNKEGEIQGYWNKTMPEGMEPEERVKMPDPKTITKISTNFDREGKVTQQWIAEKPELVQREILWRQFAKELAADIDFRAVPVPFKDVLVRDDLMAVLPVGDHHLGMLAWDKETGDDYDLKIGETMLNRAFDYLLQAMPACAICLIPFLGDFLHYDGFEAVTPTNRNQLDSDTRFPKMVRAAIRAIRYAIQAALERHGRVHVIIEIGNHDLATSVFIMECLYNIYENDPRVTIDTSPQHYHYFQFGKTLIGTHHGHGTKMAELPGIMAYDRAKEWGETEYRYWYTGHVHHDQVIEKPGCRMESMRILPPRDAYAQQKGYRSGRDMKGIVIHKDHGEVARSLVTPGMIGF